VSQCLWAAFGGVNDITHVGGHYSPMLQGIVGATDWYADSSHWSATWSTISSFRAMVKDNRTYDRVGVQGSDVGYTSQITVGDCAVLIDSNGVWYHTLMVTGWNDDGDRIVEFPELRECSHTKNHKDFQLSLNFPGGESTVGWILIYTYKVNR